MYQALMDYLTEVGAKEDERQKAAEAMIENTDIHILQLMLNDHQKQKYRCMKEVPVQSEISMTFPDEERCQVEFAVYKMSRKMHKSRFSMAMHGFEEEAKVYIPLSAFKMHRWPGGEQIASIPITVTGSVGRMHMPESTALLSVWF